MKSMSASFMPPTYLPFMPTPLGTLSLEPIWLLQANTQVSEAGTIAGGVGKRRGHKLHLHVGRRRRDDTQKLRPPCLQLPRLGEFTGPAVELFLQIGGRGTASARGNRLLAAFELRRPTAADFHSCAVRRCTGLASGHDTAAPPSSNLARIIHNADARFLDR